MELKDLFLLKGIRIDKENGSLDSRDKYFRASIDILHIKDIFDLQSEVIFDWVIVEVKEFCKLFKDYREMHRKRRYCDFDRPLEESMGEELAHFLWDFLSINVV